MADTNQGEGGRGGYLHVNAGRGAGAGGKVKPRIKISGQTRMEADEVGRRGTHVPCVHVSCLLSLTLTRMYSNITLPEQVMKR